MGLGWEAGETKTSQSVEGWHQRTTCSVWLEGRYGASEQKRQGDRLPLPVRAAWSKWSCPTGCKNLRCERAEGAPPWGVLYRLGRHSPGNAGGGPAPPQDPRTPGPSFGSPWYSRRAAPRADSKAPRTELRWGLAAGRGCREPEGRVRRSVLTQAAVAAAPRERAPRSPRPPDTWPYRIAVRTAAEPPAGHALITSPQRRRGRDTQAGGGARPKTSARCRRGRDARAGPGRAGRYSGGGGGGGPGPGMAMFRSLVASAQQRQPPGGPAGGDSGLEAQYSCPICLEVYHRPVAIGSCGHT